VHTQELYNGHQYHRTNDASGKRLLFQSGKSKITNFHGACGTRDKNVVTFEITMYNRRRTTVKEKQALQNLSTPVLENSCVDSLKTSNVSGNKTVQELT
jgi:hypothetical protein